MLKKLHLYLLRLYDAKKKQEKKQKKEEEEKKDGKDLGTYEKMKRGLSATSSAFSRGKERFKRGLGKASPTPSPTPQPTPKPTTRAAPSAPRGEGTVGEGSESFDGLEDDAVPGWVHTMKQATMTHCQRAFGRDLFLQEADTVGH